MPLLKTCANNSRLESAGDFNDCYAKNDANNVSALSLCPRPWVGESCTWDGNGWVLGKLSHSASTLAMSTRRFGIILVKLHRSEQSAARCGRTSATVSVPLTTAGWAAAARGARRATGRAWSQGHRAPARWQQQAGAGDWRLVPGENRNLSWRVLQCYTDNKPHHITITQRYTLTEWISILLQLLCIFICSCSGSDILICNVYYKYHLKLGSVNASRYQNTFK